MQCQIKGAVVNGYHGSAEQVLMDLFAGVRNGYLGGLSQ